MKIMERMQREAQAGKSAEVQADVMKRVTRMGLALPIKGSSERERYGASTFALLVETALGGGERPVRCVVGFGDRALNRIGSVLHSSLEWPTLPTGLPKKPCSRCVETSWVPRAATTVPELTCRKLNRAKAGSGG